MTDSNNSEDLEFIINLDKKLRRETRVCQPRPNGGISRRLRGMYRNTDSKLVTTKIYTNEFITEEEMKKLLNIFEKGDYVFYPTNTACGFGVGFGLKNIETKQTLLMFKKQQLPEGYNFAKLSGYFMKSENVEKAKTMDIEIINNREHYDY